MNKLVSVILLFLLISSCKNNHQSAREPVSHERQSVDMESVESNRNLNRREEDFIKKMIKKDSLHQYVDSGHGFWFYYEKKSDTETYTPSEGDIVHLEYEIRDLSDNVIYGLAEIGQKIYRVDREDFFRGFREGVKLLKQGESAWFLFPSSAAYGYHGDENKIGTNIPLKVYIKINKIEKLKTDKL
jgi:gliding motility-associated peptidyl-prolyl isomerase